MNWDIGIDLYTLLCTEQVTIENLLNSMGNSTQCSMVTQMGEESRREEICVYVHLTHCCTADTSKCSEANLTQQY